MDRALAAQSLKVGELARRSGVSVRTLHYYHEIGLLSPKQRSTAGHRCYTEADVVRLLRIRSLQQMGFSLDEVGACLLRKDFSPERVLALHLERLRSQIAHSQRLCQRLESLLARMRGEAAVSVGEFLETIEAITMFEKYYTQEQLQKLSDRRTQLGEDSIRAVEAEWPQLVLAVRAEMDKGTDPKAPAVQQLAARWKQLLALFTGGDDGIRQSAAKLMTQEPQARARFGLDAGLCEYVRRALGG
ncbi:MAG TPA: MerR family transcriptional regulator [Planctomycetota bacterium]|nr:MerR family transcriptional regulator [Planctomycetota bacterium]